MQLSIEGPAQLAAESRDGAWPIVQYWHAAQPPARIRRGLKSFRERNPDLRHLVFDEAKAEAFIAANLSARHAAAFQACAAPAMQADFLRYCAIFALGGFYIDADFRCVAGLRPLIEARRGSLFGRLTAPAKLLAELRWPYSVGPYVTVGNTMFAFREPGHPLLELAIEVATANIENRIEDGARGVWLTTGPGIFTSMYLFHRLGSCRAFLDYSASTCLAPSARLFCQVAGSHSSLVRALAGVQIRPWETVIGPSVRPVERPSPGDGTAPHWTSLKSGIFRSPGGD